MNFNSLRLIFYVPTIALLFPFMNITLAASLQFKLTGVVEAKTCVFNDTNLVIDLPEVGTRNLSSASGVQGKTYFTVKLACSNSVSKVNIIPSGTAVVKGDTTLFQNTGTAKNVGLRLLDSADNILAPNSQSKVTFDYNETGGMYTFSAGYLGTGSERVSGGSFQTVVNFTLEYS
ncbi:TPA: fimbrial protein [Enterobacter bugandensis]